MQTRSAATHSFTPRDARTVPGPGSSAAGGARLRPGTPRVAPGVTAPGRGGRAGPSLLAFPLTTLAFPPTTLGPAFVLPLRCGVGPPPARPYSRFSSGSLSLLLFLDRLPFLLPSGSRGKVASSSLPKTSSSLRGAGWELGVCESAIDSWSWSGLAPALPRGGWALQPAPVGSPDLKGESPRVGGTAD